MHCKLIILICKDFLFTFSPKSVQPTEPCERRKNYSTDYRKNCRSKKFIVKSAHISSIYINKKIRTKSKQRICRLKVNGAILGRLQYTEITTLIISVCITFRSQDMVHWVCSPQHRGCGEGLRLHGQHALPPRECESCNATFLYSQISNKYVQSES
jgi:hypothetical protein